jgi:hypothetical protein
LSRWWSANWIAVASWVTSVIALLVALAAYLGARPSLKIRLVRVRCDNLQGVAVRKVQINITNRRNGELEIQDVALVPPRSIGGPYVALGNASRLSGPHLPCRLHGKQTASWEFDIGAAVEYAESGGDKEYRYYGSMMGDDSVCFVALRGDGRKTRRTRRLPLSEYRGLKPGETIRPTVKQKIVALADGEPNPLAEARAKRHQEFLDKAAETD